MLCFSLVPLDLGARRLTYPQSWTSAIPDWFAAHTDRYLNTAGGRLAQAEAYERNVKIAGCYIGIFTATRKRAYWRHPSEGAFLGYYRGTLKGSWVAKYYDAATNAYVTGTLGEADDDLDANGRTILSYKQAFDAALRWIELKTSGDDVPPTLVSDPDMTVAQAVQAYIALRDARSAQRAARDQVGRLLQTHPLCARGQATADRAAGGARGSRSAHLGRQRA